MRYVCLKIASEIANYWTVKVLVAWAMISIATAMAGPFGTFASQTFMWRLLYWGLIIGVSLPIGVAARVFWNETIKSGPLWVEDLLVVLTMTFTIGPLLMGVNFGVASISDHPVTDWRLPVVATFFISLAGNAIVNIVRAALENAQTQPPLQERDRLLERINADQGVRLVRVSSDNHHVCVETDDGREHRILMRLRDAVSEIDVEEGLCVHRSHWVALSQIARVKSTAGKEFVELHTGRDVPIGPKYRGDLMDVGAMAA